MKSLFDLGMSGFFIIVAVLAGACGNRHSTDAPARRPSPAAATSASATETSTVVAPTPSTPGTQTWDAAGIAIERLADGSIRVHGVDRWGVAMDTTYADITYFSNAVPVIARSLTDVQAEALTLLVPTVRAAAPAP
jgi:hypothetical protein